MFNKNNFSINFSLNSRKFHNNLKKTKFFFNSFLVDLRNNKIPLLESYEADYQFGFSETKVKKFSKYKNIIVIGMGGSILGTKTIYSFLKKKINKEVFFFDNLDSNLFLQFKKIKNLRNSCFIVVSKSGNTLETITNLGILISNTSLKNKLIIITEITDNSLMNIATKYNAEIIEHKEFIGGRYSVLSESSMFPAALMGLQLEKFKNLKMLIKNKNFVELLIKSVAGIHTLNLAGINNSVILNYNSNLDNLGYWYQQLVAESLGKGGKGINPILSFGPKDHHSLLQLYLDGPRDKFFTFMNLQNKDNKYKVDKDIIPINTKFLKNKSLEFVIKAQFDATLNIFKSKKIPFRKITFDKNNEEELGTIFTFFVLETILLSRLMNLNPFDQPAVEQIKVQTKKYLS